MRPVNALKVSRTISEARSGRAGQLATVFGAALTVILCGCAGYRLGPTNGLPAREQSVFVDVFVNETLQPRLEDDFTHAVRIGVQREGTYRLGHRNDCDIIVRGVIKKYVREGLNFDPNNLTKVQDYSLVAVTHITAFQRSTGDRVIDQDVWGSTQIRADQDLQSAEREATPLLANNIARKVVDLLADGTW